MDFTYVALAVAIENIKSKICKMKKIYILFCQLCHLVANLST